TESELAHAFGVLLKDLRVASGLTQELLAERAGLSARTVSDLERGLYQAPHRDTVARLAEALKLTATQHAQLEAAVNRVRGPQGQIQPQLPTGILTLLLTEIDGAAHFARLYAAKVRQAVAEYDRIAAACVSRNTGLYIQQDSSGYGRLGVFQLASEAVAAAVELQHTLHSQAWSAGLPLRVRLALYTGDTQQRDGLYHGKAVSRGSSLRAMAARRQSLMSDRVS